MWPRDVEDVLYGHPAELTEFCRERLAVYKAPRFVEILPDLPKTVTGKLLRRELRDRAGADGASTPRGGAS